MIKYKFTTKEDIEGIVKLFSTNGNPYNWNVSKWRYYYECYPEGRSISIIALDDDKVIGHYGLLPVKVNELNAMLGLHAFVHPDYRGLVVIKKLLNLATEVSKEKNIDFIIGFSNEGFTKVLTAIFSWHLLGYLVFENVKEYCIDDLNKYSCQYSEDWYKWKFGSLQDVYIKNYVKDGEMYHQVLKVPGKREIKASDFGLDFLNIWKPAKNTNSLWKQPVTIKMINECPNDLLDICNWSIDMGDSDTFEYNPNLNKR
ncbi:MAG: GNAT family N-acetyltransferase [Clostridia bacterium]|nr:GNAT family N-acetyltransferase [Clostridia bacterium]